MKQCRKCKIVREDIEFRKQPANRDGLQSYCKYCQNAAKTDWWRRNPEHTRKYNKRRYHERGDMHRGCNLLKFWPGVGWKTAKENYDKLLKKQNSCCAICGMHCDAHYRNLSVDHCHKTKNIRGLLCDKCNQFIGLSNESIERLSSAIRYLKKHTSRASGASSV